MAIRARPAMRMVMRLFVWATGLLLLVRHFGGGAQIGGGPREFRRRKSRPPPESATVSSGSGGDFSATPIRKGHQLPVPNLVHYIFGLDPVGIMPFGILQYLSIIGTVIYLKPEEIQWHHKFESSGLWWNCSLPHLTLVPVEPVSEVHGKILPNLMVQQQSDIIRLQVMNASGGIYLDTDVIPLRSFDELRAYEFVMGKEGGDAALCNAVLIGAPHSRFIQRWWKSYDSFDPKVWGQHSVRLPAILQRDAPDECTTVSTRAFFMPTWGMLYELHEKDDGYDFRDNFAVHLWATAHDGYRASFSQLSIADIFLGKGSFHRIARKLLTEALAANLLCDHARVETAIALQKQQ
jgi:hypothetical protein